MPRLPCSGVLGLVPARGGSKGVPRKNLALLGGRPLLAWTVERALEATRLSAVVVSTEDPEIADAARVAGAEVLERPPELAGDAVATLPVIQHALDRLDPDGRRFDAVCLLQPTSPFRPAGLIDSAVALMDETSADSVVSVLPIPHHHHPDWALVDDGDGALRWASGATAPPPRRQELRPACHREGSLYLTRASVIREGSLYGERIVGLPIDPSSSVNIDGPDDLAQARALLADR
jgi:CMP-N-acetylneuraminic acid synthetase